MVFDRFDRALVGTFGRSGIASGFLEHAPLIFEISHPSQVRRFPQGDLDDLRRLGVSSAGVEDLGSVVEQGARFPPRGVGVLPGRFQVPLRSIRVAEDEVGLDQVEVGGAEEGSILAARGQLETSLERVAGQGDAPGVQADEPFVNLKTRPVGEILRSDEGGRGFQKPPRPVEISHLVDRHLERLQCPGFQLAVLGFPGFLEALAGEVERLTVDALPPGEVEEAIGTVGSSRVVTRLPVQRELTAARRGREVKVAALPMDPAARRRRPASSEVFRSRSAQANTSSPWPRLW